ncbi:unnamed protein product [Fraxinus pennsylvanica]|uniref:E1 ubiquitin-activating enzyme n=1 Tax=Fraxinus pennsylvanica TaxID=56036 RepID=A0AAD1Z1Y2_9LAMI|nr:unnamed protein product [Fraxinus pennsylvanica]
MLPRKRPLEGEAVKESESESVLKKSRFCFFADSKSVCEGSGSGSQETNIDGTSSVSLENRNSNNSCSREEPSITEMAFDVGKSHDIDEDLHSRQLAVYGRETMRRLFASNVLVSGMQGLGAEIAKNLILAGVKSVTLHDEGKVELWDLSSNFIFSENDVGKNRALASIQKLQELNNAVVISTLTMKLTKEQLSEFQAVVFTDISLENAIEFNEYCHNHQPPIAFIKTEVRGLFGIIASISNDNPALVSCVDDERLEFQDGDLVVFSEVQGMTELNDGKPRKIKTARPYSFILDEDTTSFGGYEKGGIVAQVKQPKVLNFKPLREAIKDPGDFLLCDFSKFDHPPLLHLAFQSLDKFVSELGRFPVAGSEEDAQRLYVDQRCLYFQKPLLESGTLGAKCNTQMVIPHLTENYGASRDPPEKQAPMCTVHSFPHNIDHCLTWARSEFEGLLEKTPAEVNAYLSNPAEYTSAMRNAGDAQARDNLEHILECLDRERCESFQDCITWARLKFEDYFANRVKQLTYTFPEDAVTSTGVPFWSAPKRFPRPLQFSTDDPSHLHFLMAASILRAQTFGIPVPNWHPKKLAETLDRIMVPEFQPKKDAKIVTDEKATSLAAASLDDAVVINELIMKLEQIRQKLLPNFRMKPIQFEKDDDTNYHMDLIAGLANMRARNYGILEVDKLKAKFIAGRIIPAIATSTAMATGLVCLELYKVINGGHKLEDYRNTFANLALPLFSMAEPVPPKIIKYKDMSWTVWDRWIIKGNPTLRELLKWLEDKGLNAYSISFGSCLLYNSMFPRHKERMDKKIVDVAREVAKAELPPYRHHLDIVVACEDDEDNDIDIPQISCLLLGGAFVSNTLCWFSQVGWVLSETHCRCWHAELMLD